jgi:hypothetical protein
LPRPAWDHDPPAYVSRVARMTGALLRWGYCWGQAGLKTVILQNSASKVTGITNMSHSTQQVCESLLDWDFRVYLGSSLYLQF